MPGAQHATAARDGAGSAQALVEVGRPETLVSRFALASSSVSCIRTSYVIADTSNLI